MSEEYLQHFEHEAEQSEQSEQSEQEAQEENVESFGKVKSFEDVIQYVIEGLLIAVVLYCVSTSSEKSSPKQFIMLGALIAVVLFVVDHVGKLGMAVRLGVGLSLGVKLTGLSVSNLLGSIM